MRGSDIHIFKGNLATLVVLQCVLEALKPRAHAHTWTGQLLCRIVGHLVMCISQNSTLCNKAVGYWYVCLAACPALLSQNIGALSSGAVRVARVRVVCEWCDCGPAAESATLSVSRSVRRSACCLFFCAVFCSCLTAIRQVCCLRECVCMSSVSVSLQNQTSNGESWHTLTTHTV